MPPPLRKHKRLVLPVCAWILYETKKIGRDSTPNGPTAHGTPLGSFIPLLYISLTLSLRRRSCVISPSPIHKCGGASWTHGLGRVRVCCGWVVYGLVISMSGSDWMCTGTLWISLFLSFNFCTWKILNESGCICYTFVAEEPCQRILTFLFPV
jgi:hypothetical protein